ncbi:hypothetical protein TNCV_153761 [Trichonephila clavipes]|nr:hypothetical protein TNCV_153761 [Trichonephila clavipes]
MIRYLDHWDTAALYTISSEAKLTVFSDVVSSKPTSVVQMIYLPIPLTIGRRTGLSPNLETVPRAQNVELSEITRPEE